MRPPPPVDVTRFTPFHMGPAQTASTARAGRLRRTGGADRSLPSPARRPPSSAAAPSSPVGASQRHLPPDHVNDGPFADCLRAGAQG